MLAPKAQFNLGDAKKYFKEHLVRGKISTKIAFLG